LEEKTSEKEKKLDEGANNSLSWTKKEEEELEEKAEKELPGACQF